MPSEERIIVIQPEPLARERMVQALQPLGLHMTPYSGLADCWQELLSLPTATPLCVVAPLDRDEIAELDYQHEIVQLPHATSFVFCVAHPKTDAVVQAMRRGAVGVVDLADDLRRLTAYVREGLERSTRQLHWEIECCETFEQLRTLNVGEHQVLQGIMAGKLNKEIAHHLNVSIRTIEQRRREVFRKMHVHHPASLTRKVLEAAQAPRLPPTSDECRRLLEGIRLDFAHVLLPQILVSNHSES